MVFHLLTLLQTVPSLNSALQQPLLLVAFTERHGRAGQMAAMQEQRFPHGRRAEGPSAVPALRGLAELSLPAAAG